MMLTSASANRHEASRLQLSIPIEKIEPAIMQIVGRECAAVVVQVLNCRLKRHVHRPHVELFARLVRFAQIAGGASGDDIVPGCQATL